MAPEPIPPGRFFSVHLRFSRGVITIAAIVLVLAVGISFGVYQLLKRAPKPLAVPEASCVVRTPDDEREMDIEQAQIAATIAAVAARRKLPEQAVVIAYATALQESKLYNVEYGDRDSVGVFQQRESQGWGTKKQIMDPVYSTNRFFAALEKVKGYRKMPVAEAAQAVQRSAAGYAYGPHEEEARLLAAAFTGRVPRAVHCWYPPKDAKAGGEQAAGERTAAPRPRTAQARRQLKRALGSTAVTDRRRGWLIAAWSVAHAQKYGLSRVEYAGARWSNDQRVEDWQDVSAAGGRTVELA
ncbi:hypothetical protein OUY22_12135 [Nonomuraea sp. MCN248]|uniref:Heavy metal transporter n=1 Tax=Nonomuraea corallina TaxID=2989783 RepID=A0ABT4SB54_9ACTN|nr:hypothetical protein [Nonomuraea corallina]MDA0634166.1 hypothetical protein [Nonomuraea corallina]